jgi:DNA-binding MarR family transcriptional regulator/GNAT superfamily N-acetyltransferase
MSTLVSRVREFNRFYTTIIGALDEGLVRSPYSLTEARVIFELAQRDATEVVALRRELGLDPGYLSRILARFEADGLVSRQTSGADARRQVIVLTEAGRAAYARLDRASAEQIERLVDGLPAEGQDRLLAAMGTVRDLLTGSHQGDVVLRDPEPGDYGWVVSRHGALYQQEYGFDSSFETLVARIVADFGEHHDPARERAWIATAGGERLGCVFCVREDDEVARLRLLLVEPGSRGLGVGTRLVDACLAFARAAGYRRVVLWTNDVLADARRLYQRAGFRLVHEDRHHSYGQDLVGQDWALDFDHPTAG